MLNKIDDLEKQNKSELFTKKELLKISKRLVKEYTPLSRNLLELYKIDPTEIRKGVHCPSCYQLPMVRQRGHWFCSNCISQSKDAYINSVKDYFLLIKPFITNGEFRTFLTLPSISLATKLLSSMNLPASGSTRDRVYHMQ